VGEKQWSSDSGKSEDKRQAKAESTKPPVPKKEQPEEERPSEKEQELIDGLKEGNALLREQLERERERGEFLSAEIERENRPLGFHFSTDRLN
jgi:hypothetical protein